MKKNQVIIETVVAVIVLMALLIAVTKVFLYFSNSLAVRNYNFERTRTITDKGQFSASNKNAVYQNKNCESFCSYFCQGYWMNTAPTRCDQCKSKCESSDNCYDICKSSNDEVNWAGKACRDKCDQSITEGTIGPSPDDIQELPNTGTDKPNFL